MFVKYDWNFISKKNGYGSLTAKDIKTIAIGLPEHAILTAEFAME